MLFELTDTHCHIHEALRATPPEQVSGDMTRALWYKLADHDPDHIVQRAAEVGVTKAIVVGCSLEDSRLAVDFVQSRPTCWASIGIHPHEAHKHIGEPVQAAFAALADQAKVVAIGECGLDYFYNLSSKTDQQRLLRFQLQLAIEYKLPLIFHVREAFDDFWPIFDEYAVAASAANQSLRGVVHSFSADRIELDRVLARGLYVGLNGIMTFTKDPAQLAAAKTVPADKLLLETDAPYLTPAPHRGTICEPKHVRVTAEFLSGLRQQSVAELASQTTQNAQALFRF